MKILIIDDEELYITGLKELLTHILMKIVKLMLAVIIIISKIIFYLTNMI